MAFPRNHSNLVKLIRSITGFDETDENFQICLNFAESNLLYHSYTDVNSHAVKRKISSMHEKFLFQSDLDKAGALKSVTSKLIDFFEKKDETKKERGFRILSLILLLWNSCESDVNEKLSNSSLSENIEASRNFDWTSYLREDNLKYDAFSDVSSEFSQSDQSSVNDFPSNEDSLEDLPDAPLRPPTRDDSGLGISPDSCSGTSQHFHAHLASHESLPSTSKRERNALTFYPYWNSKFQKSYGSSPYNLVTMNFTKLLNDHMNSENPFSLIEKKVVIHERNVIKEVLWMLCGVKSLFIAYWDGQKFEPNPQIHLTNLTSKTLYIVLREFCAYATKQTVLQDFFRKTLLDASQCCRTYNAYIESMQEFIQKVRNAVSSLDAQLRKGEEIFTFMNLQRKLKSIFLEIDFLYNIHMDVEFSIKEMQEPLHKACATLNILWKFLHYSSLQSSIQDTALVKIMLKIFLKTCRPYFAFLEELMILGTFKDPHEEFLIKREDKSPSDETFWESGYSVRTLPSHMEKDFFLKPFVQDILCAGKSAEILNTIYVSRKEESFRTEAVKGNLYSKFIHIVQKLMCKNTQNSASNTNGNLDDTIEECEPKDPLLEQSVFDLSSNTAKFFYADLNPAYRRVSFKEQEHLYTEQYENTQRALKEIEPTRLKPLHLYIEKAVNTCMEIAYYPVCRRLIETLKDDYHIVTHLNVMRKYFLMESGDLMFSFYSEIFQKIAANEKYMDVFFLYSALQNAISEDEKNSEKLCIFLDSHNSEINFTEQLTHLNALQLSYEVSWPVSLMLGPRVQTEYCQIFSFLLQIKGAKYLLDNLYCTSRSEKPNKYSKLVTALQQTKLPRQQKVHGMYIFRLKLMFFVNGFHNYIMTRILHSFGIEFMEALENSRTVDEMITAHAHYLKSLRERCLLDRHLSVFKEHIFQVLQLCHTFHQIWIKGVNRGSLEDLQNLEERFSKYSDFLLCCFNRPFRRGTQLYGVENLLTTMLSETHSLHVFETKD
ncbi:gamma-tubulin complex component 5 [Trichonephila inaurata madagascariensis]|uniref:Gamma-tubulin complex component n=1 Tax=Trichonephila inaurata madagascariensis TaxID=2747483 RepID=A0A8X6IUL8_9ARAC|nr:gamma-tubulin complex component 5 [Trichonephila inaurata madagascariensis]